jgi:hypothetical protein
LHLGACRDDPDARLGRGAAALGRWRPVAFAGLNPIAAAVRRPPGPAPGHQLRAVHWPSFAMVGHHPKAAAWQR